MFEIDFYASFIISIVGIAYPILLQVVSKLDDTYSSTVIVELFQKEPIKKWFQIQLYISLTILLVWSLKLSAPKALQGNGFLIDQSASVLLIITTVLLTIALMLLIHKIFRYSIPAKFVAYLFRNIPKDKEYESFKAITDVFINSIAKKNYALATTISKNLYTIFKQKRTETINSPVEYPVPYYELVYKTIEELAIIKDKKNETLESRTAGSIWLLGELQSWEISEVTYGWIWRNLLLAVRYEQDDMVMYHWQTATQYYVYSLKSIQPDYIREGSTVKAANQKQIDKRIEERKRFIEFHFALGALCLYTKRYGLLKRIFDYTTSFPPRYELLPLVMNEIFVFYDHIRDPYDINYPWISTKYPLPGLNGLKSDLVIKRWIMSYMALLFLRQYSLESYLVNINLMALPQPPATQPGISRWIDGLDFLKKLVTEHLENKNLLTILRLDFITAEWCQAHNVRYPPSYIDDVKQLLQERYEINAFELPLSNEKIQQFYNSSKSIVESALTEISNASQPNITEETETWGFSGVHTIMGKDAFAVNSEVQYLNFDTSLAEGVFRQILRTYSTSFLLKRSKSLLLKPENIFPVIDALKLSDDTVIVNFGLNLSYYIEHSKIQGLSEDMYKSTRIINVHNEYIPSARMFILKESDLPVIKVLETDDELKERYELKKISEQFLLYGSVIDLNNKPREMRDAFARTMEDDELRKSVLLNLYILLNVSWKKAVKMIEIIEYSEFFEEGLPDTIQDIQPF